MHGKTDIYLLALDLKLCLQNQNASDLQNIPTVAKARKRMGGKTQVPSREGLLGQYQTGFSHAPYWVTRTDEMLASGG